MRPALRSGVTLNRCRGGRVYKLASCPLVPTLFAFLLGSYIRGPPCFFFLLVSIICGFTTPVNPML
jgi:hypothetical protein